MKNFKIFVAFISALTLNSCASFYENIDAKSIQYNSINEVNGVSFEYKYDILKKGKYKKRKLKNM